MILPDKIDHVIFSQLGGEYNPNAQEILYNLEADEKKVRKYLGTYYPRSFIEAYETFQDLCNVQVIKDILHNKSEIYIADVGSGSGGYLSGIIYAIREILGDKAVYAIAVDGNELALDYQAKISQSIFDDNILLETRHSKLPSDNFSSSINGILNCYKFKYDIIVTSKFISEYYPSDKEECNHNNDTQGLYKDFLLLAENWLQEEGIIIMNDITLKKRANGREIYLPKIMNTEKREYLNGINPLLRCVIPLSCAFWQEQCTDYDNNCFQQRIFSIGHSRLPNGEVSKVCYQVFMPINFAQRVLENIERLHFYKIAPKNYCWQGKYEYNDHCVDRFRSAFLLK